MAAQEYFNMSQQNGNSQPQQAASPRPQTANAAPVQTAPNPPYPMYDGPPPPYSPGGLGGDRPPSTQQNRPQSQAYPPEKQTAARPLSQQGPPPQPRVQPRPIANGTNGHVARPSLSQSQQDYDSQFRPPVRQQHSYHPPEKQAYPQSGPPYAWQQQYYGNSLPVQPPYQNGQHDRKGHSVSFASGRPQERYPSRSRSESRSPSRSREGRERDRDRSSRPSQRRKKSGLTTFLGAGGGAILGDAIFPGLGTIGGALLGGFGGHEYDKNKQRARSHEIRPRERRYSDEYEHRPSRR